MSDKMTIKQAVRSSKTTEKLNQKCKSITDELAKNGHKYKRSPIIRLNEKGYLTAQNLKKAYLGVVEKTIKLSRAERDAISSLVYPVLIEVAKEEGRL